MSDKIETHSLSVLFVLFVSQKLIGGYHRFTPREGAKKQRRKDHDELKDEISK
jgi:hypothetical protein